MMIRKYHSLLTVAIMAIVLCAILAVSSFATDITGGFGTITGLDETKSYEISSQTLNSTGTGMKDGSWTVYDPEASLAGIYKVREAGSETVLKTVYVYGTQADRANLFSTTTQKTTGFVAGKWTGDEYIAWNSSDSRIRFGGTASDSSAWLAKSFAEALRNATTDDAKLTAKNNIFNSLNNRSYKYGYASTDIIAFDEVNYLKLIMGAHLYAYSYDLAGAGVKLGSTSGTSSYCEANIKVYVTDLAGNVSAHTATLSAAKMTSTRTLNFETATFTPAVPKGSYVVGLEFFPYSGWTDPSKLQMYGSGTTYSSGGRAAPYIKWTASTYYSIDAVATLPPKVTVNEDGVLEGIDADKHYQIASLTLNAKGEALARGNWVTYDPTASLAGLYQMREIDADGVVLSKESNVFYVHGLVADRKNLFSNSATNTYDFKVGEWTGHLAYADSTGYVRSSSSWIDTSYAKDLTDANALPETNDEEIAVKTEAVLAAKKAVFGVLNKMYLQYAYQSTAIIAFDEIQQMVYQAHTGNERYYGYDYVIGQGHVSSQCTTDVVLYVTDLEGNVTKHTHTTSVGRMDQDRTINFATATFTPEVPEGSYVVGIRFYPYSGWTDPDKLYIQTPDAKQQGAIKWNSNTYYTITAPSNKKPAETPEITIDNLYGLLKITNYNEECNYSYSEDGGKSWTEMKGSQIYVEKANTEYIVKAIENELYFESEASQKVVSPAVVLVGTSLVLDGKIGIKAHFDIDTSVISDVDFVMTRVDSKNGDTDTVSLKLDGVGCEWNSGLRYDEEKGLYYLIAYSSAKDVDNISFECDMGAYGVGEEPQRVKYHDLFDSFNFETYIEKAKELAEAGDPEFEDTLELVNAIEAYCDAADIYFSKRTLENEIEITAEDEAALEAIKPLSNITSETIGNLEFYGSSLILEETVTIRHYFKVTGNVVPSDYEVEGATALSVSEFDSTLAYVDIENISADKLSEVMKVTLSYGEQVTTIEYSVLNYVANTYDDERAKLRNVSKSIYKYSVEADKYAEKEVEPPVQKNYSILFIGNSYTYYNDMPTAIFKQFAEAAGYSVTVASITKGAHTLTKFADPTDEYGAKVEAALTGTKNYDYIIIQEQSETPANANVQNFYSAVRNLSQRIRNKGAAPILYSTWGRKAGSATLTNNGWTNESMTWKLAAAYQAIGDELNIPVAHAGLAFYDVYTTQSSIELYNSDLSHPSYAGSYLAAATLFAKIFNDDPTDVSFNGTLSAENAAILREAARKAVFATPTIPEEYKTTSTPAN